MQCHHCPGRIFESEEELQAHLAQHVAIQQTLRRRGGRTYGARIEDASATTLSPSDSSTQPPILPLFNTPTTRASGSPEAQPSPTPSTATKAPSSARKSGSVWKGSVDMEFYNSLAELMKHDNSYLFFRQFSLLNVQNLLWMQAELAELEKRLADMRGVEAANDSTAEEEATDLRSLIREKLQLYNDALLRYSQVSKLDRPDETSISDVRRWIADTTIKSTRSATLAATLSSDSGDHAALAQRETQKTWAWKLTEGMLWRLLAKVSVFGSDAFKFPSAAIQSLTPCSVHREAGL
ncbi:hypothetical protein V495_08404 [Pseudogymnoascus sp. VKM F-4514 (FW-929)]|nr:hypothetical protein V495_08404 [Pseudogymnoascus sp. VKM F-4514 (FW-929)]KFY54769.1 hypothetical protein V497_07427 [Pseudogymnoascus sp. VKM F-4516 (FW-969)]